MIAHPTVDDINQTIWKDWQNRLSEMKPGELSGCDAAALIQTRAPASLEQIEQDETRKSEYRKSTGVLAVPVKPCSTLRYLQNNVFVPNTFNLSTPYSSFKFDPTDGWVALPCGKEIASIENAKQEIKSLVNGLNESIASTAERTRTDIERLTMQKIESAKNEVEQDRQTEGDTGIEIVD